MFCLSKNGSNIFKQILCVPLGTILNSFQQQKSLLWAIDFGNKTKNSITLIKGWRQHAITVTVDNWRKRPCHRKRIIKNTHIFFLKWSLHKNCLFQFHYLTCAYLHSQLHGNTIIHLKSFSLPSNECKSTIKSLSTLFFF